MMRLSVCLGCCAVFFFKEIDEMIGVLIADGQRNLMDFIVGGKKEVCRGLQPFLIQVFYRWDAESGGKTAADIIFAHMIPRFQIIKPQRFYVKVIQIVLKFQQIGRVALFFFSRGKYV